MNIFCFQNFIIFTIMVFKIHHKLFYSTQQEPYRPLNNSMTDTELYSGSDTCSSSDMPATASVTSRDQDRKSGSSNGRILMRPWLEGKADSGSIPGLEWVNRERTLLRIPWTHASRQSWHRETDSSLYRQWVQHTGGWKHGIWRDAGL